MSGKVGDNVFRASGVIAAAAAGREGTVDWDTTPKVTGDSPVTAATGSGYFLNTTAGTITINLPAGAAGSIVSVADYAGTWQTNKVTVSPNGSEKIGGVAADVNLQTEGQSVTFVYVDSTQGWLNTMDSTSNVRGSEFMVATGGTISCSGDYKIHTFTGPGTFCVSATAVCSANNIVDYMVVAGAGSGGGNGGGGGGAGGFRLSNDTCMSAPLTSPLANATGVTITASPYAIAVGGGGAGISTGSPGPIPTKGINGSVSTFSTITSAGGGAGGGNNSPVPDINVGGDGGSGGGSGVLSPGSTPPGGGGSGNTPPTSPLQPQGNNGGTGYSPYAPPYGGGGGGGAGAVGSPGAPGTGPGGAGSYVVSTGFAGCHGTPGPVSCAQYFAGGGGAGRCGPGSTPIPGGDGGGGAGINGNNGAATAGTTNSGGGGGGMSGYTANLTGAGGSGVVILRYKFQ